MDTDKPQAMTREEHARAHLGYRASHLGHIPERFTKGVTLYKALAELWLIDALLCDYGIEHSGYGLLEQHTRLAMMAARENNERDLMKRSIIRAHRAEDACRDMAALLDDMVTGWDVAAAVAYEGGDEPGMAEPPDIAKARAILAKYNEGR